MASNSPSERDATGPACEVALRDLQESKAQVIQNAKFAAMGQMAAGLAHELNTPLSVILSSCEFLLDKVKVGDVPLSTLRELLELMHRTAQSASQVIAHFRLFSRENGPNQERFDLCDVVNGALLMLRERLRIRGVTLETSLAQRLFVMGHKNRVEQVIVNLINNAAEAMALVRVRTLILRISRSHSNAVLTVQDSGSGMPQEVQEKIGTPFFTTKADGTGLGLWSCFGIVKGHGGTMDVRSAPGRGTTVTIHLPLAAD